MVKEESVFWAGDWVEVRSFQEISATLESDGTFAGLPFMPEMGLFCGQRFKVARRFLKTCIELAPGNYVIQKLKEPDIVLLEGLTCTGAEHGGCQRGCVLLWKTAWLRKATSGPAERRSSATSREEFLSLPTMSKPDRYFCQSTELQRVAAPMSKADIIRLCWEDLKSGDRSWREMLWLVAGPVWRKATRWIPRRRLVGKGKKTPAGNLNLQNGELVGILSPEEIAETLDVRGRNRGLGFGYSLCKFRGPRYRVKSRLDRMILESTGEMKDVQGTVLLEGTDCLCENVLGGCPRQDPVYWREVWLKRVQ